MMPPYSVCSRAGKRAFDIVLSVVLLILLLPLMGLVVLLVRIRLGPPVLFCQERPGLHGRPFVLLKFRTMTQAKQPGGSTRPDADRLTPLSCLVRSASVDELPELINVLRGDMSLVGPRPLLMEYLERYSPEQMRRHEVRPGITGWAQVKGRNSLSWEEKFKLDVWYVDNLSIWLDMKILLLTTWKVLKREGISAEGHVTMPRFDGSEAISPQVGGKK